MPKWTARSRVRLDDTLSELGMPTAFSAAAANFSGMVGRVADPAIIP